VATIKFNINAGRYINEKGQFIKEEFVLNQLDSYRIQNQAIVKTNIEDYLKTGDYNKFLTSTSKVIRDSWTVEYIVGKGGVKNIQTADFDRLNIGLTKELTRSIGSDGENYGLLELVSQYENGYISSAQFGARAQVYAISSRKAYYQGQDARQNLPFMQRFLHGNDNCPECISYANAGIQPTGKLPLPGEACRCRSRCNCTVNYLSARQYQKWLNTQINTFTDTILKVVN
jgi:hypothetical protein